MRKVERRVSSSGEEVGVKVGREPCFRRALDVVKERVEGRLMRRWRQRLQ